jgi:hypothetical protein
MCHSHDLMAVALEGGFRSSMCLVEKHSPEAGILQNATDIRLAILFCLGADVQIEQNVLLLVA